MKFKEQLKEKLKEELSREELDFLPRGFQTIGSVMILKLKLNLLEKKLLIANACLDLLPYIKSVYINLGKVKGEFREPENIVFLAGENNPIVEHKEHGVMYRFDFTKIMFSKGNLKERKLLAKFVKDGEVIVDMFAGIGYFSLPIAMHSNVKEIYSIELNPLSYDFLVENIKINRLEEKITAINGNSKVEVIKLSNSGVKADRVIMGVFPAPKEFIKEALTVAKDEGTMYHYEGVVDKEEFMELFREFEEIAEAASYSCELKSKRFVKSYGPNLYHVVLDILVKKK
jgi:tRNA wybutosine-synthesizing protein 2